METAEPEKEREQTLDLRGIRTSVSKPLAPQTGRLNHGTTDSAETLYNSTLYAVCYTYENKVFGTEKF